jgi:hypothetical protein
VPYYVGEDMPEWEAYFTNAEDVEPVFPPAAFKYIEPWAKDATVISFPTTPGPELDQPVYTPKNFSEYFAKDQAYRSTLAVNAISTIAQACREAGITHVIGSYQGGNDEGFTHFHAIHIKDGSRVKRPQRLSELCDVQTIKTLDLADGRSVSSSDQTFWSHFWGHNELMVRAVTLADGRRIERPTTLPTGIDFSELVENAVTALMGHWGAGSYELYGAVTIDIDARTISDEKDRDAVFAAKVT